jgi:hypothetical protein
MVFLPGYYTAVDDARDTEPKRQVQKSFAEARPANPQDFCAHPVYKIRDGTEGSNQVSSSGESGELPTRK